ncbi:MAG: hypothetical protein KKB77_08240 [Bacteroidetes bacterium]|nr:hypothetical protein [Bacteroidota bacterium]
MQEDRFEVVLINDDVAFAAKEATIIDECWVDFCSPPSCPDECGIDFSG